MTVTILRGDVRDVLRTLPDESVHCAVTSPPYWGLRDYGTAKWDGGDPACDHIGKESRTVSGGAGKQYTNLGSNRVFSGDCICGARRIDSQIGLEATPQEYVRQMVAVFREVRRVLRDDGTLWLNLGSSHFGSGKGGGGTFENDGMTASAGVLRGTPPTQSQSDALPCGNGDTAPQDSPVAGRACPDCGGELTVCSLSHRVRTAGTGPRNGPSGRWLSTRGHGSEHSGCASASRPASPTDAPLSTMPSSSWNGTADASPSGAASEPPSLPETSGGNVQDCERNSACSDGTVRRRPPSSRRTSDTVLVCVTCGYSSRPYPVFKPKDLVPIPWMVAMALQADGWYLRQDVIWSKPNPMPESVIDRCTKSHEYIFLLSKRASYYYDAEAVKEPGLDWGPRDRTKSKHNTDGFKLAGQPPHHGLIDGDASAGRNRRSVWTVATQPFKEAHFATFPTQLVEPMILAGTSAKGCCPTCGKPWERVVDQSERVRIRKGSNTSGDSAAVAGHGKHGKNSTLTTGEKALVQTIGWHPGCAAGTRS